MTLLDAVRRRVAAFGRSLPDLRRPAYTGENRCWPCSLLNGFAVVVLAATLSLYSPWLGALVLACGVALVVLRGYVVPGTPRFAPKLVAPLPVEFGHGEPDGVGSGTLGREVDPEAVMGTLIEQGVLQPREDDLFLDDAFRAAWEDRMADLRAASDDDLAARAAAAASGDVEASVHGDRLLLAGGRDVWLSRPIATAEVAAVETLAAWDVPEAVRAPAAEPLRTFVRTCPACGGRVRETTLQNCCGGPGTVLGDPERAALACADCDATVFVFEGTDTG